MGSEMACLPVLLDISPDKHPGTVKSRNDAGDFFMNSLRKWEVNFNSSLELGRI